MSSSALAKIPLGRAGLQVTPICFGTSGFVDMPDTHGSGVEVERAMATVGAIFDGPVNFPDSSRIHGMGRGEERIGAVIPERGLPPGVVISTKLDRDPETAGFDGPQARRSFGPGAGSSMLMPWLHGAACVARKFSRPPNTTID